MILSVTSLMHYHMTSPWQHILSVRVVSQNGVSDTPVLSMHCAHSLLRKCRANAKCYRLRGNPAYGIRALFTFLIVAHVEICQSPDFVIHMSNYPSNCCRRLRRPLDLYKGEISLHFDPPSRPSCRTRSPLLWALIST